MTDAWMIARRVAGRAIWFNSLRLRCVSMARAEGRIREYVFMRYALATGEFDRLPPVRLRRSRLKSSDILAGAAFLTIACGMAGYMVGGGFNDAAPTVVASSAPVPAPAAKPSPFGDLSISARALRWSPNRIASIETPAPKAATAKASAPKIAVVAEAAPPAATSAPAVHAVAPMPEPRPASLADAKPRSVEAQQAPVEFHAILANVPLPPANPFRNQRLAHAAPQPQPQPQRVAEVAPAPVAPPRPVAPTVVEPKATPVPPAPVQATVVRPQPAAPAAAATPVRAPVTHAASIRRGNVVASAAPQAAPDERGFFERLFNTPPSQPGQALAYARPDDGLTRVPANGGTAAPSAGVAVYDIESHVVILPNGERLEAHSGLGELKDNPSYVHVRMRGATPPHVYDLTLREKVFHGVRALRLTPADGANVYGRTGLLAHTFMLGPNGDSNGCVSFRDYNRFLQAYLRGEIRQLKVVARGASAPATNWFASRG